MIRSGRAIYIFMENFQSFTDILLVCAPLATISSPAQCNSLDSLCNEFNSRMASLRSHLGYNAVQCLEVTGEWKSSDASIRMGPFFDFFFITIITQALKKHISKFECNCFLFLFFFFSLSIALSVIPDSCRGDKHVCGLLLSPIQE